MIAAGQDKVSLNTLVKNKVHLNSKNINQLMCHIKLGKVVCLLLISRQKKVFFSIFFRTEDGVSDAGDSLGAYNGKVFAHRDRRQDVANRCFDKYEKRPGW
jgi:hypothetical protein